MKVFRDRIALKGLQVRSTAHNSIHLPKLGADRPDFVQEIAVRKVDFAIRSLIERTRLELWERPQVRSTGEARFESWEARFLARFSHAGNQWG